MPREELTRTKLGSPAFWRETVASRMLPLLRRVAAAVEASLPLDAQAARLQLARALALGPCAWPGCTNLRGCSEGRLAGRRCGGGCGLRFCCDACAAAAWPEHALVCGDLAAAVAAAESSGG